MTDAFTIIGEELQCHIAPTLLTLKFGEPWEGGKLLENHPNIHLPRRFLRIREPGGKLHRLPEENPAFLREDILALDRWNKIRNNAPATLPEDLKNSANSRFLWRSETFGLSTAPWISSPFYKGDAKQRCRERIANNWQAIIQENQGRDRLVHWTLGGPALQDAAVLLRGGLPLDACHSFESDRKTAFQATLAAAQLTAEYPHCEIHITQGQIEDEAGKTIIQGKKKNLPNYVFLDTQNTMGIVFKLTLFKTLLEIFRNPPAKYECVPLRMDITLVRGREDLTKGWEKLKSYNLPGEPKNDTTGLQKSRQVIRLLNDYLRPEHRVALPNGAPIAYNNEEGGAAMLYIPTRIETASHETEASQKISELTLEQ